MNLLAIETSSSLLSVAVKKGNRNIQEKTVEGFFRHAENLISLIDELLKKEKLSLKEIDTFLIGRGPGSFTGLRIGFATLKGFLCCEEKKCRGALSLDIIAEGICVPEGSSLGILLDARREKIYARFYQRRQDRWENRSQPMVLTIQETIDSLSQNSYIAGDAIPKYQKEFQEVSFRKNITPMNDSYWYPKASALIQMHLNSESNGYHRNKRMSRMTQSLHPLVHPKDFVPLYFRRSEAEERKSKP